MSRQSDTGPEGRGQHALGASGWRLRSLRRPTKADPTSPEHAAREKLRQLNLQLPSPFSAEALCAMISRQRGRPIVIEKAENLEPDAPCGMWVETREVDYFLVASGTTPAHRDHIVLHELAHVLYDHQGLLGEGRLSVSLPNLSPALIKRILGRGAYGPQEELEAEVLASIIMERAGRYREDVTDDHDREVLAGLSQLLE